MTKTTRLLVGCAAIALVGAADARAETFRLSIGSGHPASAAWIASMQDFLAPEIAKRVAERTEHEIEWTEAYGGSVCKLGECLEAVEAGLLDVADLQTPFDPAKLQAHNFAYFVPFGTPDPRVGAKAAWETYERVPELKEMLEERYNQVFLGVGIIGNYGLSTTFPWESIDDLQGHKLAAAGPNIPWLEGTGIVPVQTTLNEAYTALQTGVYEGWIMFADALVSFKLIEVADQFADIGFGTIPTPLVTMNKDTWDGLPPEVQEIILEVGEEWNAYIGEFVHEQQQKSLQTMADAGVTINEVSDEQRKAWAERLPNLPKIRYEEIEAAGQPGEAVYTYIDVLKEMGHEFPRDWAAER